MSWEAGPALTHPQLDCSYTQWSLQCGFDMLSAAMANDLNLRRSFKRSPVALIRDRDDLPKAVN